jgi:hypothetical protein
MIADRVEAGEIFTAAQVRATTTARRCAKWRNR